MMTVICLWWIGCQLSAPVWYYILLGVGIVFRLLDAIRTVKERKKIRHLL